MSTYVLGLLVIWHASLQAQIISGTVFDLETKAPLPYANIGVKGKGIGGISDVSGRFSINFSGASHSDSVIFSYIGYRSQSFSLRTISNDKPQAIFLRPVSKVLDEVVVVARQEVIILGNDKKSRLHTGWGDFTSSRGRALGLLIPAHEFPVKVNNVVFHLHDNEFDSVRLRINFLERNQETVLPVAGQSKSMLITTNKKGWIRVPVPETIVLNKDIVVAVEWVDAWAKPRTLEQGGSYSFTLSLSGYDGFQYRREKPEKPLILTPANLCPSIFLECVAVKR